MSSTGNTNPGNFANRPKEEVSEIAKKGGESSHQGGFASMDPDKQVTYLMHLPSLAVSVTNSTCRRRLHQWVVKHQVAHSKREVRLPKRQGRRVDCLPEGYNVSQQKCC